MTNLFKSFEYFREQFNQRLHDLLGQEKLGTFILVLANSTQYPQLFVALHSKLKIQLDTLYSEYVSKLHHGKQINQEEDLLVFFKKTDVEFGNIKLIQHRTESHCKLLFNHIRSFRQRRQPSFLHAIEMYI